MAQLHQDDAGHDHQHVHVGQDDDGEEGGDGEEEDDDGEEVEDDHHEEGGEVEDRMSGMLTGKGT